MNVNDIISYHELVSAEKANLQKGMNYGIGKSYSVFLMSLRRGAPYADRIDAESGTLIYEGHDQHRSKDSLNPKLVDQPLNTPKGSLTENGKFFQAAMDYKNGVRKKAELVKVYEKIANGIWCYKGFFELVDALVVSDGIRKVFNFHLKPVERKPLGGTTAVSHTRLIPTHVKVEVWRRDRGRCVECGSTQNLHYDHDIPYSKGGSSITALNVRLLCAKHNLEKSDRIMSLLPWIAVAGSFASGLSKN